jgi:2-dehydropantoate 2-reductase
MVLKAVPRVLIWGAGAIGGTLGAFLQRAGVEVTLVDQSQTHIAAIGATGLSIVGPVEEFCVRIRAETPETVNGRWHYAFLAVKAQHTEAAVAGLIDHLDEDAAILSLQNGLMGDRLGDLVGAERAYTAMVDVAADLLAPGVIRYGFCHPMPIGPVARGNDRALGALVELVRHFDPQAFASEEVGSYIWGKNVFSTITCATALGTSPMAELVLRKDLEPLWRGLAREVLAVAAVRRIRPASPGPFYILAMAPGMSLQAGPIYLDAVAAIASAGAKPYSGMWRDLAVHHRPTEAAALNLPIADLGDRHGKPCPGLRRMVGMIGEIETGRRSQADDNLVELLMTGLGGHGADP